MEAGEDWREALEEEFRNRVYFYEHEKWKRLRLVFIGAGDPECLLSLLPMELVTTIAHWAAILPLPSAWALRHLQWFKSRAGSPSGCGDQAEDEEEGPPRRSFSRQVPELIKFRMGYEKEGIDIEYCPGRHPQQRFRITKWTTFKRDMFWSYIHSHFPDGKKSETGYWSEAEFLVQITYDPTWHQLFDLCDQ
jgi:hypothetical protein